MSFACRRGRVQEPQKVGSAVVIAIAIAVRVVEVVELQGRRYAGICGASCARVEASCECLSHADVVVCRRRRKWVRLWRLPLPLLCVL